MRNTIIFRLEPTLPLFLETRSSMPAPATSCFTIACQQPHLCWGCWSLPSSVLPAETLEDASTRSTSTKHTFSHWWHFSGWNPFTNEYYSYMSYALGQNFTKKITFVREGSKTPYLDLKTDVELLIELLVVMICEEILHCACLPSTFLYIMGMYYSVPWRYSLKYNDRNNFCVWKLVSN